MTATNTCMTLITFLAAGRCRGTGSSKPVLLYGAADALCRMRGASHLLKVYYILVGERLRKVINRFSNSWQCHM